MPRAACALQRCACRLPGAGAALGVAGMSENDNGNSSVVHLRMTDKEYARSRSELGERKHAAAKWDQQLAVLFIRSKWTQADLAKAEGKTQAWVSYHLLFGRFLGFITTVINAEMPDNNLTERKFRTYWEQTAGTNERQRFVEVQKLIVQDHKL